MTQTTTPLAALSARQAADILGITHVAVHKLVGKGRLRRLPPPEGERPRSLYVRESDVLRYKRERKPVRSGREFTDADRELLRQLWPTHSNHQCALALHATRHRTAALAAALGLPPKEIRASRPRKEEEQPVAIPRMPAPAPPYCPHLTYTYITVGSPACRVCKDYGGQDAEWRTLCLLDAASTEKWKPAT